MAQFEIVVSRQYYKTFHWIVEAPDLAAAERLGIPTRDADSEGTLQGGDDEIIDVRPVDPHPVEAYEVESDTGR